MYSEHIKEETLVNHRQLEKHLVQKIKQIENISDYTAILKGFYGFIFPLEQHILAHINHEVPDMAIRRKSAALVADIQYFEDVETADLCPQNELPAIRTTAEALGAMYVLEGSTLGGEIITDLISKKLKIPAKNGFGFFTSYGERRMPMWLSFKKMLNDYSADGDTESITLSAKQTFAQFYYWLTKYENKQ